MSLIFEFSISKLGNMEVFMKTCGKKSFHPFLRTFLTNRGKNEDEDEKISEKGVRFLNSPYQN